MLADSVPNKFPTKPATRRICVIGEAPGMSEVHWHTCQRCQWGFATQWRDERGFHTTDRCTKCFSTDIVATPTPFVGPSGWLLNKLLAGVGIDRDACFVGNVCQVQPPGNEVSRFKWDGAEMQDGLSQLKRDLAVYQPHFCLLLGNTPLRAFKGPGKFNISDWRGSLFMSDFGVMYSKIDLDVPVRGPTKCMATYHPAALLREAGLTGVARFDFARAAEESRVDGLAVPQRDIQVLLPS